MGLMDSLGLDNVEADPNALPDGTYGTTLYKAGVLVTKKDKVAILLSFKVNDGGKQSGKEKAEFFNLGEEPGKDEAGNITFGKPTMTEIQKSYFKKRMLGLGIPENKISEVDDAMLKTLIGNDYFITVYNKGGYCNISDVKPRTAGQGDNPFATPNSVAAPAAGPTTGSVSDLI